MLGYWLLIAALALSVVSACMARLARWIDAHDLAGGGHGGLQLLAALQHQRAPVGDGR